MSLAKIKARGLSDEDALRVMHGVLAASAECNVAPDHILFCAGDDAVRHARKLAMYEARRLNITLRKLGVGFRREPKTVLASVRSIAEQRGAQ